jgi:Protein of unknown function (DUF4230)
VDASRPVRWFAAIGCLTIVAVAGVMVWQLVGTHTASSERSYEALHSESKLVPASQDAKVTVTLRDDDVLPDFLSGQKAVVDAEGRVEAYFDLSELHAGDVSVDGTTATVHLPPVQFSAPSLSGIKWRVDRRGLLDRVRDLVSTDDDFRNRVVTQLNAELEKKGFGSGELARKAAQNVTGVLEDLLRPLGVTHVKVDVPRDPATSS